MSWLGLALLGLFVLPVGVSICLPDPRGGVPWYQARRDPTGLAPEPATTPEAVIQVYGENAWEAGVHWSSTWRILADSAAEVNGFEINSMP